MSTPLFFGKYKATVTNIYDDEEERGRIKVKCPAITGDDESAWCEPCFPCCKDSGGDFYLPDIGETVWVEFENGDPNTPIWVSNWHSEKKTPIEFVRNKEPKTDAPPLGNYQENHSKTRVIHWKDITMVLHEDYFRVYIGDEGDTEFYTNFDEIYLERKKGTMKFYSNDNETYLERRDGKMQLFTDNTTTFLRRDDSDLIMVDNDTQLFKAESNIKLERNKITITTDDLVLNVKKDYIAKINGNLSETVQQDVTRNASGNIDISAKNITENATDTIINKANAVDDIDSSGKHLKG